MTGRWKNENAKTIELDSVLHFIFLSLIFLSLREGRLCRLRFVGRFGDWMTREFGEVVFETMRHIFVVHDEFGRFFEEKIYQREIAFRMAGAQTEVPIDVTFDDFCKTYYIDLLVSGGAIFELKSVETLADRHRSQLMHYLFLTDVPHGKLVNLRPERVSHEFVNNVLTHQDRTAFEVVDEDWIDSGGRPSEGADGKLRLATGALPSTLGCTRKRPRISAAGLWNR